VAPGVGLEPIPHTLGFIHDNLDITDR